MPVAPEPACRRASLKAGTGRTSGRAPQIGDEALLGAALRFLSSCDRTQAQMKAYLARRGSSPGLTRVILARLRDWGYLDDDAFAVRWAQARVGRRPMGRARLEAELLAKGFDAETTARTLRKVYPVDRETELAEALLRRGDGCGRKTRTQQAALLRRAGFQEETIESLIGVGWSW